MYCQPYHDPKKISICEQKRKKYTNITKSIKDRTACENVKQLIELKTFLGYEKDKTVKYLTALATTMLAYMLLEQSYVAKDTINVPKEPGESKS